MYAANVVWRVGPRPGLLGLYQKGALPYGMAPLLLVTRMSKETPPLHRPTDLPPPEQRTIVRVDTNGKVKERQVWDYCKDDVARQRYALGLMRKARLYSPQSYGGQPSIPLRFHVRKHAQAVQQGAPRGFYLLDLKHAFPSIDQYQVRDNFYTAMGRKAVGITVEEQNFLEEYLYDNIGAFLAGEPGAPQGNATSSAMLDLAMLPTDSELSRWFTSGIYTRYIDDLTFSAPAGPTQGRFYDSNRRSIRTILQKNPGVQLNDGKTHNLTGDKPVTVTGITFNRQGLFVPSQSIQERTAAAFDDTATKLQNSAELTERDILVFDGYRGALAIAGPPERSGSQAVRTLYNRSIKLGNRLYQAALQQGVMNHPRHLQHAAATRTSQP